VNKIIKIGEDSRVLALDPQNLALFVMTHLTQKDISSKQFTSLLEIIHSTLASESTILFKQALEREGCLTEIISI